MRVGDFASRVPRGLRSNSASEGDFDRFEGQPARRWNRRRSGRGIDVPSRPRSSTYDTFDFHNRGVRLPRPCPSARHVPGLARAHGGMAGRRGAGDPRAICQRACKLQPKIARSGKASGRFLVTGSSGGRPRRPRSGRHEEEIRDAGKNTSPSAASCDAPCKGRPKRRRSRHHDDAERGVVKPTPQRWQRSVTQRSAVFGGPPTIRGGIGGSC